MITRDFLLANHADLVEAFRAEGRTAGLEAGRTEGASAERARIQAVFAQAMPGHTALLNKLAFDGKTTGPEAAAQILAAERTRLGKKAEDIAADAADLANKPAPTPAADPGAEKPAAAEQGTTEERMKAKWDGDAQLRADYGGNFKAFEAHEKAIASGRVRVLGKTRAA